MSNSAENATFELPHITDVRVWSPTGQLDNLFSDPHNLNLSNDAVALITALTTLASILFLADLVTRIVVRARRPWLSARSVLRGHALARASNPLIWPALFVEAVRGGDKTAKIVPGDGSTSARAPLSLRVQTRLAIVCAGFVVVATELIFIYLSTSSSHAVAMDKNALPSLAFERPDANFVYDEPVRAVRHCNPWPVTRRRGFTTLYPLNVCTQSWVTPRDTVLQNAWGDVPDRADEVWLDVNISDHIVMLRAVDREVQVWYDNHMRIVNNYGNFYRIKVNASVATVAATTRAVLALRGIPVRDVLVRNIMDAPVQPRFRLRFVLSRRGLRLSGADEARGADAMRTKGVGTGTVSVTSVAWCLYIADAARSTLSFTGRTTGVYDDGGDDSLQFALPDNPEFVVLQRPRLSVLGGIAMLSGIVIVWFAVALQIGWHADADHRQAWVRVFEGMDKASDLRDLPSQSFSI